MRTLQPWTRLYLANEVYDGKISVNLYERLKNMIIASHPDQMGTADNAQLSTILTELVGTNPRKNS